MGPVEDRAIYQRGKDFATSITAGDVVVKHQDDSVSDNNLNDDAPF